MVNQRLRFISLLTFLFLFQKYPSQPLYDTGIPGPGPSNFLEPSHPHTVSHTASHTQHHHSHTAPDKDVLGGDKTGPQPKATHYLASNCVLLTYFQGEAATLVDEHFTRSLGQPSSFTLDKPAPSNKPYVRSGKGSLDILCEHETIALSNLL